MFGPARQLYGVFGNSIMLTGPATVVSRLDTVVQNISMRSMIDNGILRILASQVAGRPLPSPCFFSFDLVIIAGRR